MTSDGDSEPKRKRRRSFVQWNELSAEAHSTARTRSSTCGTGLVSEYSEARCRPDGFYLGEINI